MEHLQPAGNSTDDREVVIVDVVRSPIGKARNGIFKDKQLGDLMTFILQGLVSKTKVNMHDVGEIVLGNVLGKSAATHLRMAVLAAGFPIQTSVYALSRQCGSGLQALINAIASVEEGYTDVAIAIGAESMTHGDMLDIGDVAESVFSNKPAQECLIPMGTTSDTVATKYGVTRTRMDEFATLSHQRAHNSRKQVEEEILPFGDVKSDEGIRPNTSIASLSKLKCAFGEGGTTAGNSSQVSDGACAALVCTRAYAKQHNLPILGKLVAYDVVGVPPGEMGIGPKYAIEKLLNRVHMKPNDVKVYEINEAFASQAVWCVDQLGIPVEHVNRYGGAIAIGHPLGMTGIRLVGTALRQAKQLKEKYAVVSMCIGTGMGIAALLQVE